MEPMMVGLGRDGFKERRRMAFIALGLVLAVHPIYSLVQILYLAMTDVPWFIRRDLLVDSIVVNLSLDGVVVGLLLLNLRPPRCLGEPERILRWSTILATMALLAGWGIHYHWGGTQSSQMLAVILGTFVLVSWFLSVRTLIALAFLTMIYVGGIVFLEVTGIIPYAPLFKLGPDYARVYTSWPVVMVNMVIYFSAFAVVLGATLRNQRVVHEGRLALEREVAERVRAERMLRGTLDRLARTNDELRTFIRGAAHDLRSPLTAIEGYASLLEGDEGLTVGTPGRRRLDRVLEGAEHMGHLLDDLSRLVLEDAGEITMTTCDTGPVVQRVLRILHGRVASAGAKIHIGPLPSVLADESRLVQIFQNLLENALKYSGQKAPEIHIEAHSDGDLWTFGVHDRGVGIEPGALQKIFEPFSRVGSGGDDRPDGHGIGLSVCHLAVRSMGGRIWAEHREGGGSSFYFTLPMVGPEV